jgi:hypothetical protein
MDDMDRGYASSSRGDDRYNSKDDMDRGYASSSRGVDRYNSRRDNDPYRKEER